jgi:HK97 family phage prohead protease
MLYPRIKCGLAELKLAPADPESGVELMTFSGYGAAFNNIDSYGDMILPGAFADQLSRIKSGTSEWPAMLLQHGGWLGTAEDEMPVGIWTELSEDGVGLRVSGKLADTQKGKEAYSLLKMTPRPAITGLSIGYIPIEWENRSNPEDPRRKLKKINVLEISLVTFAANPKAKVDAVKSGLSIRDVEKTLRDAGLSRTEAKALLAEGWKALPLRDAEDEMVAELAAQMQRNISTLKS